MLHEFIIGWNAGMEAIAGFFGFGLSWLSVFIVTGLIIVIIATVIMCVLDFLKSGNDGHHI